MAFIKKNKIIYFLYFIVILLFSIYSYSLVDLNLTLFNHKIWDNFRSFIIQIGYFNRGLSTTIYFSGIIILFLLYYLTKKAKPDPVKLAFVIGLVSLIAYPFLSHDFFNYMFDAKIFTLYGQNPYLHKALDYPADTWLRFMHWTHRTYPYGPVFLILSFIPSFLAFGKLILNFIFFKAFFAFFYVASVYFLSKINKNYAVFFATNPFIIIEGLINSHNDIVAIGLGIAGIYFLFNKQKLLSRILFLLSGGVKYISAPIVFLSRNVKSKWNLVVFAALILLFLYLSFFGEIQPWYFLNILILLPFFPKIIQSFNIFFAGLLFSYYPFIAYGDWGVAKNIELKHWIILTFFVINLSYLFVYNFSNAKKTS